MTQAPGPSGFLFRVVKVLLPKALREPVLGDLTEGYHRRARLEGRSAANQWLRRECREAILSLAGLRHGAPPLTPPRPWFAGVGGDLRYALRAVLRRPLPAVLALSTLGIGIGATTALFSALKPALIEALPYPGSDRIALIAERDDDGSASNIGYLTFDDLRRGAASVEAMAALANWHPTLLGAGESRRLTGQKVSHQYLRTLGVAPAIGRDFVPADDRPGAARVVILSHRLWRDRFGADPGVVGRAANIDGIEAEVIGVMGNDFESLLSPRAEIWGPLRYDGSLPHACRTCRHLRVVGRLAEGVDLGRAGAELSARYAAIIATSPHDYPSERARLLVQPLRDVVVGSGGGGYLILFAAVIAVLLLACVNVANLLLGQAVERQQEFAVRRALGAGRGRVVRQVLLESGYLGVGGAALGALIAGLAVRWLAPVIATTLPRADRIDIDWPVLAFAAGAGLFAALGFGAAPAIFLGSGSHHFRQGTGVTGGRRFRRALVVIEVALAAVLLAATTLLGTSMERLLHVDPGFEPDRLFTLDIQVAGSRFADDSATWRYVAAAQEAASRVPGVTHAALASQLPLGGNVDAYGLHLDSRPRPNPEDAPFADRYAITPGYFEAMGIRLLSGRSIRETDRGRDPAVAVVSESVARLDFAGLDPIGQGIRVGGIDGPSRTVVGVVADVRHHRLDGEPTRQVYIPTEQWGWADAQMILVARTTGDPTKAGPAIVAAVRAVDPDPTLERPIAMTAVIGGSVGARRLVLGLFRGFAGLALLLSAVGVYGVMAGGVAERRREFGIRSALGQSRGSLVRSVVADAATIGVIGTILGTALWLATTPVVRRFLYGVEPHDPISLVLVGSGLIGVAILAALRPAWRAGSQSPATVLRSD